MKKETHAAYMYLAKCIGCNKVVPIYFTVSDFGEAPILRKCKNCDTLYWYTVEDETYIQPLEKQLEGKLCVTCNTLLNETLVPTHTYIKCDDSIFSLDDDFAVLTNLDESEMENIEVYLLY